MVENTSLVCVDRHVVFPAETIEELAQKRDVNVVISAGMVEMNSVVDVEKEVVVRTS